MRILLAALVLSFTAPAFAQTDGQFDCIIEARQMVDIRSPVEGLIEKVPVDRGDAVKRGQVVVTLESGPERAALAVAKSRAEQLGQVKAAEAKLELARRKETRAEELSRQNFVSNNALEEARTERMLAESELKVARESQRLAELEVQRANEALALRTIRSPINGVVVERIMKAGELASTNVKDPIMRLAEIDPLNVEVILPASLYGTIRMGDSAEVSPETPRGRYAAQVVVVDKVINAASGTFGVRLELPNSKYIVPAGARCKVRFTRSAPVSAGGRPNQ
ncbi:MAG: efflux RND transporter periplasmic adaptor subunit [Burkholderiales bacterium]|nr:efflux RND transporter periplasmic adaptor subunit [Burkholderiales bacterium]